ncbi:hypothetical protein Aduo_014474 [Ancylostoma duodenale]
MWSYSILILTVFAHAFGEFRVQKAKYGAKVSLQAEPGVKEWQRVKKDGTTEYVQYCGSAVGLGCNMFADERGRFSCPSSSVTVSPTAGTLTLHFMWKEDAFANYSAKGATPEVGP